jgi:carbamoyl-phosphate synthase large subunit
VKILVTGGGSLLGQGIIKALKKINKKYHLIVVDVNPLSAGLYWGDERYLIPYANSEDYLESIKKLLQKTKADFVFIGTDVELLHFAENKKTLESEFNTKIIVSSNEVIKIADDKLKTASFFKTNGFEYPITADPNNLKELEDLILKKGFPLIVKPRVGARSFQVSKVNDKKSLEKQLKKTNFPIVQEYIGSDSNEYTASSLCFDGICRASIVLKRDLKDGNTYRTYYVDDKNFNSKIKSWTEALKPFGPINFQFRIDRNGEPKVFEINARFSGTTPLRAIMGFNEIEMCINKLAYNQEIIQPKVKNYTILRNWSETIIDSLDYTKIEKI